MTPSPPADAPITEWLQQAGAGRHTAFGRAFSALYPDLRRIAHARLYHQGGTPGLSTTQLVHDSFLKLAGAGTPTFDDRRHFLGYAARTMRHLIVDEARAMQAQRRGGDLDLRPLDTLAGEQAAAPQADEQVLAVHEALGRLESIDPDLARIVELRWFGGYSEAEIAEMDGVSERTVRRHWERARAWLEVALAG